MACVPHSLYHRGLRCSCEAAPGAGVAHKGLWFGGALRGARRRSRLITVDSRVRHPAPRRDTDADRRDCGALSCRGRSATVAQSLLPFVACGVPQRCPYGDSTSSGRRSWLCVHIELAAGVHDWGQLSVTLPSSAAWAGRHLKPHTASLTGTAMIWSVAADGMSSAGRAMR